MNQRQIICGILAFAIVTLAACNRNNLGSQRSQDVLSFAQFSAAQARAADPNCDDRCQGLRTEFRYIVYVGQQIYCYWEQKKLDTKIDYDALAASLEQLITTQTTMSDYANVGRRWAASLHDGHVNFFPTDISQIDVFTSPVRLTLLAPGTNHEQVVVTTTNGVTDLQPGDVVTELNGVPIAQALDQAETKTSGSTQRMRRFDGAMMLLDAIGSDAGTTLTLTVNRNGTVSKASVPRVLALVSATATTRPSDVESVKILPGNVGYVKINGFEQDEKIFDRAMNSLASTVGLILDLRQNGGGDLSGDKILSWLATNTITRYKRSERYSDYLLAKDPEIYLLPRLPGAEFITWHDMTVAPNINHYAGKVVALIGTWCFSACDTFSAALKGNNLATMVGEPTGGGTGTPEGLDLPTSGMSFRYSVVRGQTPQGTWIEGTGTSPDIYVERTIDDVVNHHDSQLKAAIESILGTGKAPTGSPAQILSGADADDQPAMSPTHEYWLNLQRWSKIDEK